MDKIGKYKELINRLEKKEYSFDQEIIKPHCLDWRKSYRGTSELIIFPNNTEKLGASMTSVPTFNPSDEPKNTENKESTIKPKMTY